ncbi:MAG: hypothetical protein WCP46_00305 [Alphaproteobacteria bacterium]
MAKRRKQKNTLPIVEYSNKTLFCGFPLVSKNVNQLWKWEDLSNVEFGNIN